MLQWSHAFSDVETRLPPVQNRSIPRLQWSHAFSDVETCSLLHTERNLTRLQWSHAFSDVETFVRVLDRAAKSELQWSHAFSDVETMGTTPEANCPRRCFNGATPSQTWKQTSHAGQTPGSLASMEPRLLRRGNMLISPEGTIRNVLQWSHAFSDVETWRSLEHGQGRRFRFNGATPSQTWKPCASRSIPCLPCNRFNGATPSQTWKPKFAGKITAERLIRFNGATPSQTWKRIGADKVRGASNVLQWSHAFSDVETRRAWEEMRGIISLQWSHAFSDVETPPCAAPSLTP